MLEPKIRSQSLSRLNTLKMTRKVMNIKVNVVNDDNLEVISREIYYFIIDGILLGDK